MTEALFDSTRRYSLQEVVRAVMHWELERPADARHHKYSEDDSHNDLVNEQHHSNGAQESGEFEKHLNELDKELRAFSNGTRQLGSSVGILASAFHLHEALAAIRFLFLKNAAEIFPDAVKHESYHMPAPWPIHEWRRFSRDAKLFEMCPQDKIKDPELEDFPGQIKMLGDRVEMFVEQLREHPEFTDEEVMQSLHFFHEDLEYWTSCLSDHKGRFARLEVKQYLHGLMSGIGEHFQLIAKQLSAFTQDGVPAISSTQKHATAKFALPATPGPRYSQKPYRTHPVMRRWLSRLPLLNRFFGTPKPSGDQEVHPSFQQGTTYAGVSAHQAGHLLSRDGEQVQVELLEEEVNRMDPASESYVRRLRDLSRLCSTLGCLPRSYFLHDELIRDGDYPDSFGGFSDVWKARYGGRWAAVKVLRVHAGDRSAMKKAFYHEVTHWKRLKHRHIVPFLGISAKYQFSIVSEWMSNGDLVSYLKHYPETKRLPLVFQAASAMEYMHLSFVVHGDIKGRNILINSRGEACLSDFGLAVTVYNTQSLNAMHPGTGSFTSPGTTRWAAPERLIPTDDPRHTMPTTSSDVYSFGMTMWEVYSLQAPFHNDSQEWSVMFKIRNGKRPPQLPQIPSNLWPLMKKCWMHDQHDRPDSATICRKLRTELTPGAYQDFIDVVPGGESAGESTQLTARLQALLFKLEHIDMICEVPVYIGRIRHLEFSPDGKLVATCSSLSKVCVVWHVDKPVKEYRELWHLHQGPVYQVAWSPGGDHLLTRHELGVTCWKPNLGQGGLVIGDPRSIEFIAWLPDSEAFIAVEHVENGSQLFEYNVTSKELKTTGLIEHVKIHHITIIPDGTILLGIGTVGRSSSGRSPRKCRAEKRIIVYSLTEWRLLESLPIWNDVSQIAISSDGKAVLVSYKHLACPQLWKFRATEPGSHGNERPGRLRLERTYVPQKSVEFAGPGCFGGDEDQVVLCGTKDGRILCWDRVSGVALPVDENLRAVTDNVSCIAWNRTAKDAFMFATGSRDGQLRIWTQQATSCQHFTAEPQQMTLAPSATSSTPPGVPGREIFGPAMRQGMGPRWEDR